MNKIRTIAAAALLMTAGEAVAYERNSARTTPQTSPTALEQLESAAPGRERVEVPDVGNIVVAQMPDGRKSISEQSTDWERAKEGGDSTVDDDPPYVIKDRRRAGPEGKAFHNKETSQNLILDICVAAKKCPLGKSFSELSGETFAKLGFNNSSLGDFCLSERHYAGNGACPGLSHTLADAAVLLRESYQVAFNSGR